MASPRRELSDFERGKIIGASDAGENQSQISRRYGFPRTTVQSVLTNPNPDRSARTGRRKSLDERDERRILREIRKNPKISYLKLYEACNLEVSYSTFYCILKEHEISNWVTKKRPFLTLELAVQRLAFAM